MERVGARCCGTGMDLSESITWREYYVRWMCKTSQSFLQLKENHVSDLAPAQMCTLQAPYWHIQGFPDLTSDSPVLQFSLYSHTIILLGAALTGIPFSLSYMTINSRLIDPNASLDVTSSGKSSKVPYAHMEPLGLFIWHSGHHMRDSLGFGVSCCKISLVSL